MMSEDIVTPSVINYNKMAESRIPAYILTGGGFSLQKWQGIQVGSNSYSFEGALGALLNRRYGTVIFKQLVTVCRDSLAPQTSYDCLDGLIKANGGAGLSDELSRLGATVFSLASNSLPAGFGFPPATFADYTFNGIDLSKMDRPQKTADLAGGLTGTTHYFSRDTIRTGSSSYVRAGVRVPAKRR